MRTVIIVMSAALAVATAACGGGGTTADPTTPAGDATSAEPSASAPGTDAPSESPADVESSAPAAGAALHVVTTEHGDILADAEGRTLYLFTPDEQGAPTCYDDCAQNWPPFVGPAEVGAGVDEALVGVAARDDGSEQVTYNDWPLYYFANDAQPGDMNGQGVGGVWFVIGTDGEPVEAAAADPGPDDY